MTLSECELAFARAMLEAPHDAARRLVYADWLEERGDARAALVREAEGWEALGGGSVLWLAAPASGGRRTRYSVARVYDYQTLGSIASVYRFEGGSSAVESWYVCRDGSTSRDPDNWAWLLSLALARGLVIPGLAGHRGNGPGPATPIPED